MTASYAAFSLDEHAERMTRAREALGRAGFDICVSIAPETHDYLAGYDSWVGVNSPQALIFSSAASGGGQTWDDRTLKVTVLAQGATPEVLDGTASHYAVIGAGRKIDDTHTNAD